MQANKKKLKKHVKWVYGSESVQIHISRRYSALAHNRKYKLFYN